MGAESFVYLLTVALIFFCLFGGFFFLSNYGVTQFWLSANKSQGRGILRIQKNRQGFHQNPKIPWTKNYFTKNLIEHTAQIILLLLNPGGGGGVLPYKRL